jgi:hypothetical protein
MFINEGLFIYSFSYLWSCLFIYLFVTRSSIEKVGLGDRARLAIPSEMTRRRPGDPIRRPPRLSESELIEESHQVLTAAGVRNHLRAQFVHGLSQAVIGNPSPRLNHLQAKLLPATTIAWKRAYQIVLQFLDQNNLVCTKSAFEAESPNTKRELVVSVTPDILRSLVKPRELRLVGRENVRPATSGTGNRDITGGGGTRPKTKPNLTIIPPSRTLDDHNTWSPTRASSIPREIVVDPPGEGSPVGHERVFGRKLPPMDPQPAVVYQSQEPRPRPLSPRSAQDLGGIGRARIALKLDIDAEPGELGGLGKR